MGFSEFLNTRRASAKTLVANLRKTYEYVSVLGVDVKARSVRVNRNTSGISAGRDTECGFVVKLSDGKLFYEYSLDDIAGDMAALAGEISESFRLSAALTDQAVGKAHLADEPLVQSFARSNDFENYTEAQLLDFCKDQCAAMLAKSDKLLNAMVAVSSLEVSKLFVSENRELDQNYTWVNGMMVAVYRDNGKVVQAHEGANSHLLGDVIRDLPGLADKVLNKAAKLTTAGTITPGVYDVITDPSITGLIAHEAFGHGVEMD